uniref:Transposase, YhgA-like n=1 Tax=Candidatus Kentrum sp. TC TaxID=2126339 RepID=A0A451A577_9GAMM|nr:MAG: Putative transposase, YhgA-like [Candidatus Kentron sp. TC]VFK61186.1 MAG: Putative transposase, YhgA-like [Candidatus Kentron sp. TC]
MKYIVEILKQWEKENPKWENLPAIVSFVFYHGATKWKIPNEFLHLVDAEESWHPYFGIFSFRFWISGESQIGSCPKTAAYKLGSWP